MKKSIRLIINLLIIVSTILVATGCSSGGPQKLTLWINGRDSFIGANEQTLPQDQWYISQAIKRFEAKNPGVSIELIVQSDAFQAHQTFRTAGLAGNAPDMANLWSGQFTYNLKDVITPLNGKLPKSDVDQLIGWDTVTVGGKDGNPILGYPTPDNQMCFFLYNKKIVQAAGLDFEKNPPRTMDDFMAALDKIKGAGYVPLAADEGAGYPYYFFYIAAYWWVQQNGFDPILAEDAGRANFTDDKALIAALNAYHEIYAKGYMNQDAATSGDSVNKFLQGKVALFPSVPSFINDAQNALGADNVGAIIPPNISADAKIKDSTIGGPGQDIVISKNSKHVDTAIKFLSFLNSKEEVQQLNKVQTKVPIRKDLTESELGLQQGSIGSKLFQWSKTYVFWVDNSLSSPVVDVFSKQLPLVLTGKMTPEELAKMLDDSKAK